MTWLALSSAIAVGVMLGRFAHRAIIIALEPWERPFDEWRLRRIRASEARLRHE